MTDILRLKSLIAEFAGHPQPDARQTQSQVEVFLTALSSQACDAIHLRAGRISSTYGKADDMTALAQDMAQDTGDAATVFVCSAQDDPDHVLFCGAQGDDVVILRTRSITIDSLVDAWSAAGP